MKKILLGVSALFLLALDWAAAHDILKGEPNPWQEYAVLILSAIFFALLLFSWIRRPVTT